MASIEKLAAIDRLTASVEMADAADLVEIYNELFPEAPTTEKQTRRNPSAISDRVIAHMTNALEVEEILDLWNVIFPEHREVWYDDDDGTLHYNENTEPAELAE